MSKILEAMDKKKYSKMWIEDLLSFINEYGQTDNEVCAVLGYAVKDCSELLISDGYFYIEYLKMWFLEYNSLHSKSEEELNNILKVNAEILFDIKEIEILLIEGEIKSLRGKLSNPNGTRDDIGVSGRDASLMYNIDSLVKKVKVVQSQD